MFSTLRTRFGIPGVISVIALVFAMLGGAYAASSNTGGKATTSAKAQQGPRGPKGPKGAKGATGPAGPQGPAGPAGAKGDSGAAGANGTSGTDGQSVTSSVAPPEPSHCLTGGSKFVSANGTTYACNGTAGPKGPAGSPWPAGGTLPANATETGIWGYGGYPAPSENSVGPEGKSSYAISYPIPLDAAPKTATFVDAFSGSGTAPGCPGIVNETPTAEPGNLCVYATGFESAENLGLGFISTTGAFLEVKCLEKFCSTNGTWAVTGVEAE